MNHPIAVFWHTRLRGGWQPNNDYRRFDETWGKSLFEAQNQLLHESGLLTASQEVHIGLNGDCQDGAFVDDFIEAKLRQVKILTWGEEAHSELPTMNHLHQWVKYPEHQDWYCLYFHAKGYSHPHDALCNAWRNCMMHHLVRNWRTCVADLDAGFDSVGCHWISGKEHPGCAAPEDGFWGGNFFWSKASYLATLPAPFAVPQNEAEFKARYSHSEGWFCSGKIKPKVKDYHHSWPDEGACKRSIK